jgi:hypothetical protein
MRRRVCGYDGYIEQEHKFLGNNPPAFWRWTNPWRPNHRGACPECGSEANHKLAGLGMTQARCARCGHQ